MRLACFVAFAMCCHMPVASMGQEGATRDVGRPVFPAMPVFAADGVVHLLPSTMPENSTLGDSGPDRWMQRGFALKMLIARLYRMDETRVEFADEALANRRFDVSIAVPREESEDAIAERVKEALRTTLHLSMVREVRQLEVYVVTSPQGPGPGMKAVTGRGIGGAGLTLSTMRSAGGTAARQEEIPGRLGRATGGAVTSGSLSAEGALKFVCSQLEQITDRPVVDETGLQGTYEIRVRWDQVDQVGFFRRLHEELGLIVAPGSRGVELLVVRGD